MNRPIKLRGWDAAKKRMLTPIDLSMPRKHWKWLGEHDVPLMQFTGLKDKNGKEIYEGDIIKVGSDEFDFTDQVRDITAIEWLKGYMSRQIYVEVIGNIYENPELITEV